MLCYSCAVPGDYGSISLKFPVSSLPTNYNSSEWMSSLKMAIVKVLTVSHKVQKPQIEIESTQVKFEEEAVTTAVPNPAQQTPRHNLLRRSDSDNVKQKLFVYVNILPLSASAKNISSAKEVSQKTQK